MSNSNVNLPQFTSVEVLVDNKFNNFALKKTKIVNIKLISYSPHYSCNIAMNVDIMFNREMLEMFRPASAAEVEEINI